LSYIKHRVYLLWDSSLAGCVVVIYLFIWWGWRSFGATLMTSAYNLINVFTWVTIYNEFVSLLF
jgi:hypothetical protein